VREITEKIKDPQQKVSSLLRFFDKDQDGYLSQEELAVLWAQASGGLDLPEGHYKSACSISGADPKKGVDAGALTALYNHGLANLDEHFAMLQDLLCTRLTSLRQEGGGKEDSGNEEEKGKEKGDEGEDDDGDNSCSSGETEVLECDDEDEFEEVLRILGLQPATVTENGDLRLPNGLVAGNRDVAHIWKQRGQRLTQLAVAARNNSRPATRSALMLSNSAASYSGVMMTHRQQLRESKKMVAVLRRSQKEEVRMGIHQNMLQRAHHMTKIRTTFGDASGGR